MSQPLVVSLILHLEDSRKLLTLNLNTSVLNFNLKSSANLSKGHEKLPCQFRLSSSKYYPPRELGDYCHCSGQPPNLEVWMMPQLSFYRHCQQICLGCCIHVFCLSTQLMEAVYLGSNFGGSIRGNPAGSEGLPQMLKLIPISRGSLVDMTLYICNWYIFI